MRSTGSYVGESECNGVGERFIRTLKEEGLYLHDFESLEQARQEIGAFIERLQPRGWLLLERHGYQTPAQVREELALMAALLGRRLVQKTGTGSDPVSPVPRLLELVREPRAGHYERRTVSSGANSVQNDDPGILVSVSGNG